MSSNFKLNRLSEDGIIAVVTVNNIDQLIPEIEKLN